MLTLGVIKSPWCTHQAMRAIVIKIIDQPRKIREFGRAVTYPGRLGARYTGLGAQNLNFFFFCCNSTKKYVEEVEMA